MGIRPQFKIGAFHLHQQASANGGHAVLKKKTKYVPQLLTSESTPMEREVADVKAKVLQNYPHKQMRFSVSHMCRVGAPIRAPSDVSWNVVPRTVVSGKAVPFTLAKHKYRRRKMVKFLARIEEERLRPVM